MVERIARSMNERDWADLHDTIRRKEVEAEEGGWELERARCAADRDYWWDRWVETYDSRLALQYDADGKKLSPYVPFHRWPKQVEFVDWLDARVKAQEEGLCEKSRDTGATFLCCGYVLHEWLYTPGFKATFGSRKEEYVDKKGDSKSIFEKLRSMLYRMPQQLLPKGFKANRHDNYMLMTNPENGATISGEGGRELGRGDRVTVYIVDEAEYLEDAWGADKALSGTTDCVIWVSSVESMTSLFAHKRFRVLRPRQITQLHWRDDPRKDAAWAQAKKESKGIAVFASEFDIDYSASQEGVIIPGIHVNAAIDAHLKLGITGFGEGPWSAALDVADGGMDVNALAVRKGVIIKRILQKVSRDTGETARWAINEVAPLSGRIVMQYDCIGVGTGIKSEANRLKDEHLMPANVRLVPWDAAGAVLDPEGPVNDRDSRTNKDHFQNIKAQAWWRLAERFAKTYRAVENRETFDPDELISLDLDHGGPVDAGRRA